jgi:phosphoribosyl 1,2-cyclic phosphodiesterase
MKIRVLGAHNTESLNTRYMSLLVDDVLAIDAGCLTSTLTFEEQSRIQAVLLTHGHYDHIRDIPALAINLFLRRLSVDVYSHQAVYDNLIHYFLNGNIYPEFHKNGTESSPTLNIHVVEARRLFSIGDYEVLPVPVNHSIVTMGYQVTAKRGQSFFYSGDTGSDLSEVWSSISPKVLFIEVTSDDKWMAAGKQRGHLTPSLLKDEMMAFRLMKGYLPKIIAVHMNPVDENSIRAGLAAVAIELNASIELAFEGKLIEVQDYLDL